jgi:maltooligosyltrehalose trehalohydrolase
MMMAGPPLGATFASDGSVDFRLWAPRPQKVELILEGAGSRETTMRSAGGGYRSAHLTDLRAGSRYRYRLDDGPPRADPASRSQPDGVLGPSAVVDPRTFAWHDAGWQGIPQHRLVFYELHVGTFSPEGTFAGVAARLPRLADLGITALELMPVAQFSGTRNWGYDGVFPFAVQNSYGGLAGLQALADATHGAGMALFLDVVYNHMGPEGSFLSEFGPYYTAGYRTPWGDALNFADSDSDAVRRYFIESAVFLAEAAHLDGFRVDAVHAIVDPTARPFLADLTEELHERSARFGRPLCLVAESALNDPRVVRPVADGGLGFDAIWNDDFHHAVHARLTGETDGYYVDFGGRDTVTRAFRDAFVLSGQYSEHRKRRHGSPAGSLTADRFVVCDQDHDQVGNRAFGERLSVLLPAEGLRLAAGLLLLSPYLPLLFMGEEYGETAPFLYFTDHQDPKLAAAVREGRRAEFASNPGDREPPDPQAPETFQRSRLREELLDDPPHRALHSLYRELLRVRREMEEGTRLDGSHLRTLGDEGNLLFVEGPSNRTLLLFHLGSSSSTATYAVPVPAGRWTLRLDSSDARWGGPGRSLPPALTGGSRADLIFSPRSYGVYRLESGAM